MAARLGLPPPPPGSEAAHHLPATKLEKHDYKYSLHDNKYDPVSELGTDHLVLPGGTTTKHDPYNPDSITEDKYQTPDHMSHLSSDLHARYALPFPSTPFIFPFLPAVTKI